MNLTHDKSNGYGLRHSLYMTYYNALTSTRIHRFIYYISYAIRLLSNSRQYPCAVMLCSSASTISRPIQATTLLSMGCFQKSGRASNVTPNFCSYFGFTAFNFP